MYTRCLVALSFIISRSYANRRDSYSNGTGRIRDLHKPLVKFEWVDFKLDKRTFPCVQVSVQTSELEPAGGVFTRFEAGARLARAEQTRHSASTSPPAQPGAVEPSLLWQIVWRRSTQIIWIQPRGLLLLPALFTLFKLSYRRLTPQWDFDL